MADRFRRVPRTPEVHVFQAEICSSEQIVAGWKPQHRTIIANSGHHSATFWQPQFSVTVPLTGTRFGGTLDLRNELFF